jgi:hypothetical protein
MSNLSRTNRATVLALAVGLALPTMAGAQCTYPTLADGVSQTFSTTPSFPKFTQPVGRWAAIGVRATGAGNWDIGLSLGTSAFPSCVQLPVAASQSVSGVDFVVADFGSEGTGTYYAPILRQSGTGACEVEWDSGPRTVVVDGGPNQGGSASDILECWSVTLVGGVSYNIDIYAEAGNVDDYRLYLLRRDGSNSFRGRADALLEVISNTGTVNFTVPSSDTYVLVAVNNTATSATYVTRVLSCTDPPNLLTNTPAAMSTVAGSEGKWFEFQPVTGAFPTIAVRGDEVTVPWGMAVGQPTGPGFPPCSYGGIDGSVPEGPVDLLVGDYASGVLAGGGPLWLNTLPIFSPATGTIEYDPGMTQIGDALSPEGTVTIGLGPSNLVRTMRVDLAAGNDYSVHIATCGGSLGRLRVFQPCEGGDPIYSCWFGTGDATPPVADYDITNVNDFTFTPTRSGPHALVLTNQGGATGCWQIGVSQCAPRLYLADGVSQTMTANPEENYFGQRYGMLHTSPGWSATAVRSRGTSENWQVQAYALPAGGGSPPFGCFLGVLSQSQDPGNLVREDFLVRYDLYALQTTNTIASGRIVPTALESPLGGAQAEFQLSDATLVVNDPPIENHPVGPLDIVDVYEVFLFQNQMCTFFFLPEGANTELYVFRPDGCGGDCDPAYGWLNGPLQELSTTSSTQFAAPVSGLYGLVVVNHGGGTGRYSLGVSDAAVSAPPASLPGASVFVGIAPTPTRGPARFDFALAHSGSVSFEIVDLAGRVISRIDETESAAGWRAVTWSGMTTAGAPAAPGVYFARMRLDGEKVGARRIVIAP